MAGEGLSPEDEAALREMSAPCSDLRSEGDPHFFCNGAQIELFGLQGAKHLNRKVAEVVGFDNDTRRYRLLLHSTDEIKQVAKKNMKAYTPHPAVPQATPQMEAASAVFVPGPSAGASSVVYIPGPNPGQSQPETALALVPLQARQPQAPSREMVKAALSKVVRDTTMLHERCAARQMGIEGAGSICDVFLRLTTSFETYLEIYDLNKKQYGEDEELKQEGKQSTERFDEIVELYTTLRTWTEMAQDEWNLTHYSIRKHGIVGTLKNEFIETAADVVDLADTTAEVVVSASSHVATHAPRLARAATTSVGGAVSSGSTAVARVTTNVVDRSGNVVSHMVEDQIVGPVKRAWHLLVTSFLLCFIIPLFALRTYAPLNSVASNLGLVYSLLVLTCPPSFARGRAGKAGLLVLYPLVMVVLPLALHYWVMHPGLPREFGQQLRGWAKTAGAGQEKLEA